MADTAEKSSVSAVVARAPSGIRASWPMAVLRTARPRQWPKNLLVFAAPLAGATLGRHDGIGYAAAAFAAFVFASAAIYFVNDLLDVERDRAHPEKRRRPIAAGDLPRRHAAVLAACWVAAALAISLLTAPRLAAIIAAYLALSLAYSMSLKHIAVIEVIAVAAGFVLRVLGGATATHVPPSGWFLLVCSLGALTVALAKRYSELTGMGAAAIRHRPVMARYSPAALRLAQRVTAVAVVASYVLWAVGSHPGTAEFHGWRLASVLPVAAALLRFDRVVGRGDNKPVEDLIARDPGMIAFEVAWLVLFVVGLVVGGGSAAGS